MNEFYQQQTKALQHHTNLRCYLYIYNCKKAYNTDVEKLLWTAKDQEAATPDELQALDQTKYWIHV